MSNLDAYSREALLAKVQQQFGWTSWREDPWQSGRNFFSWLEEAPDNLLTVLAVNETEGRQSCHRALVWAWVLV